MNNTNRYRSQELDLQNMRQKRSRPRHSAKRVRVQRPTNGIKKLVFMLSLIFLMIFSFMIPLRPTHSILEKRELTAFPEMSIDTLSNGDFFDGFQLWFSDTFPAKDFFVSVSSTCKSFFGFGDSIYGETEKGDEIPDIPKNFS